MHSLWTDEVASNISEELEGAKCIICSEKLCGIVEETTEIQDMNEEELLVDEIREWLEKIRQTGYVFLSWTTCGRTACHFIISRSKENKAADRDNAMQNTHTHHTQHPYTSFLLQDKKSCNHDHSHHHSQDSYHPMQTTIGAGYESFSCSHTPLSSFPEPPS